MLSRSITLVLSIVAIASPAAAQDYGGGWAVPSLDTAISIGNDVIAREAGLRAAGVNPGRRGSTPAAIPRGAGGGGVFSFASQAQPAGRPAGVQTSFKRTAAATQQAKQNILRAVAQRQPDALEEYRQKLPGMDFARGFRSIAGPYGLSANDAADAMTGYWVISWVVSNGAELPTPQAVRAARNQVVQGFAQTAVGRYPPQQRQILADEAIFNFLVLNQAWRTAKGADGKRLADATQRNFRPLGANLRQLRLTNAGFAQR